MRASVWATALAAIAACLLLVALQYRPVTEVALGDVEALIAEVERVRGLSFAEEPEVFVVSREWVLERWGPAARGGELRLWEEVYRMTLLVPPGYNLTRSAEAFTASWIAASAGGDVYVIKENFLAAGEEARWVLVHELVHVLQGQHFKVPPPRSLDERLAVSALIEGDADFVARLYASERGIELLGVTSLPLSDPPLAIEYFPYAYGWRFVEYLYDLGGWDLVNRAYEDPPVSTEQVVHPSKFVAGEEPEEVGVRLSGGLSVLHSDRMGYFYIYVLVASTLGEERASAVAEGWAGDALVLAENSTHKVLVWRVLWDSPTDAEEFYRALAEVALRRGASCADGVCYVGGMMLRLSLEGRVVTLTSVVKEASSGG